MADHQEPQRYGTLAVYSVIVFALGVGLGLAIGVGL